MSFWKRNWGDPQGRYLDLERPDIPEQPNPAVSFEECGPKGSASNSCACHDFPAGPVEERLAKRFGKIRSALGEGTVINGKLSFDVPVRIDGKLKGEVFSSKALIVGEKGEVDATVVVDSLIVMGSVKGSIKAAGMVELLEGASIEGDLQTPFLIMVEGAVLNGRCRVSTADKVINVAADSGQQPEEKPRQESLELKPPSR